jgi:hypothetical protein
MILDAWEDLFHKNPRLIFDPPVSASNNPYLEN